MAWRSHLVLMTCAIFAVPLPVAVSQAQNVVINEFMAVNNSTLQDGNGAYSDWIEIYNNESNTINLDGWYLTDNAGNLDKWRFPSTNIAAGGFLVVFASGKAVSGYLDSLGYLHTTFMLSGGGEYLALVEPGGLTIAHEYTPQYPAQTEDVSYGLMNGQAAYFTNATPDVANSSGAVGEKPKFSRSGGVFTDPFSLVLTADSPGATIRYTLDGTEPDSGSTAYSAPLAINTTTRIRARVFVSGMDPGPVASHAYLALDTDVKDFDSNLPIVVLDSFGYDYSTCSVYNVTYPYQPVYAVFVETDFTGRAAITNSHNFAGRAAMRVRGRSSKSFPKKSYALELQGEDDQDRNASIFSMSSDSDWILYAPYSDKSLMRNYLTYMWSRRMGHWAPRGLFCEVFVNMNGSSKVSYSDYVGVYVFMEANRSGKDRIDIETLEPWHNSEPEISGGYRFEMNVPPEYPSFGTIHGRNMAYKEPNPTNEITPQQETWSKNYINQFENVLWAGNFDPTSGVPAYFDIDASVNYDILKEMAKEWDSGSTYLYKDRDGKLTMGPVWDYNMAYGNSDYTAWSIPWGTLEPWKPDGWTGAWGWSDKLVGIADYEQAVIDRWTEVRQDHLSTATIVADINAVYNLLSAEAAGRNFTRWSVLSAYVWANPHWGFGDTPYNNPPMTYQGNVDWMKDWLTNRITWLDSQHLTAPGFNYYGGSITSGFQLTISAPMGNIYYTLDGSDPRAPGGTAVGISYGGPITLTENTVVRARARDGTWSNGGPVESLWSGLTEAVFVVTPATLAITEIMYHPHYPEEGTSETNYITSDFEFIEIRNVGGSPCSLAGVRFLDGIEFDFTYGTAANLSAGEYAVVVRNLEAFKVRYSNWASLTILGQYEGRLANQGEQIQVGYPPTNMTPIISFDYEDDWYPYTDGEGFSLALRDPQSDPDSWDSKLAWRHSAYIDGSPGQANPALPYSPGSIVINEALTHQDNDNPGDWIELYNTTASPVGIGGWFLSDSRGNLKKFEVPGGTTIPAYSYIVFTEYNDFGTNAQGAGGFALSEHGDSIYLSMGSGGSLAEPAYREFEDFDGQDRDMTFGRHVKSNGAADFPAMSAPTTNAVNAYPLVGPVVISEIMYHPQDSNAFEFVELHNTNGSAVPLYDAANPSNTWQFSGAISYTFPEGVTVPVDGCVLVVPTDESSFRSVYTNVPLSVDIYGPYMGRLNNAGEALRLFRPGEPEVATGYISYILVEQVRYNDEPPWPVEADGLGPSLERLKVSRYANDSVNWVAAANGGTPGVYETPQPLPQAVTYISPGATWKYLDDGSDQGTNWTGAGFPDGTWSNGTAELGYGDGDEATLVGYGPDSADKYITTYFRRTFIVEDASAVISMTLKLVRDDGAVAYINGTEVARDNMPGGPVGYQTLANTAVVVPDESAFFEYSVSTAPLVDGTNVLAVEIHQTAINSSDISFNAELTGLVQSSGDNDGDGLPDAWETTYGLNPDSGSGNDGALGDPDGDGMNNLAEYISGTAPDNPNSLLAITAMTLDSGGVRVDWQGGAEARQHLQRCNDLLSGLWQNIRTNEPPTPIMDYVIDTNATGSAAFYRIRAQRP